MEYQVQPLFKEVLWMLMKFASRYLSALTVKEYSGLVEISVPFSVQFTNRNPSLAVAVSVQVSGDRQ